MDFMDLMGFMKLWTSLNNLDCMGIRDFMDIMNFMDIIDLMYFMVFID
jgi:hypothetical protein